MALAVALVQALDPVVLESRDVKVMRVVLRVLARLLELLLMRLIRPLEWVCRRGNRRWKRWPMPTLVQFPLSVERRRVELKVLLVRMLGLVSRHLQRRWSQFGNCS